MPEPRPVASAFALTTRRTDGFCSFEQPAGIHAGACAEKLHEALGGVAFP